ncbi:unnamed protein product [Caenorhabditis angaria]|uniref:C-type lectin domain-containing protein n=1 Tax=Caenorhabditis angaria TaxID=860376 RepID=A0A9P1IRL2_9PELO|nr:unnamed protein product [Caenorhabditis angaria]
MVSLWSTTNLLTIARSNREFFQSGCASLGGKLVSIHTAIDNNAIAKYATGQGNSEAICIGLTCYKDNDPANCLWADQLGNASRYNNFQPGYPQFNNGSSVYMTPSTGKWVSGNCDNLLNAICETDMIGECSYKFGDNCYYPLAVPFHHYEELNICEQMCSGSLVSIHSPEENEYIRGLFIDPSITSINIGAMLSRENYWSDGTTWDYENFNHSSIHDGRCYSMSINDGKWNSINCSSFPAPTICKWKASSECRKTCTEPIYREKTGYIYSPGYYYYFTKYRGISPCYYVLHVPSDSAVIWFRSLNLDSKSSIELYSDTGNSTPIAVITQGNQNYYYNTPLTSPSQLIKLVYNQCESNCDLSAFYGWKAQFGTNYGAKCGEILYTTGVISSQNYPNNYPNNYGCSYYFQNAGEK